VDVVDGIVRVLTWAEAVRKRVLIDEVITCDTLLLKAFLNLLWMKTRGRGEVIQSHTATPVGLAGALLEDVPNALWIQTCRRGNGLKGVTAIFAISRKRESTCLRLQAIFFKVFKVPDGR
jgi:hypothetical protein